jgi:hypothetical protein
MDDDDALIPPGLVPDPVPVDFRPVEHTVPGMAMRRGEHTSGDVTFVLLAASLEEYARELDEEMLGGLKFWAQEVADGEAVAADDDEPFDLGAFLKELIEDRDLPQFALQVGTAERTAGRFVWLIDKPIAARRIHLYAGGDSVCVSINEGNVKFLRPFCATLDVPPRRKKPAPKGCSIKAFHRANYNIEGAGPLLDVDIF